MTKRVDKTLGKKYVRNLCPKNLFGNVAPKVCPDTVFYTNTDCRVAGCRGITCEECWNQESEEE